MGDQVESLGIVTVGELGDELETVADGADRPGQIVTQAREEQLDDTDVDGRWRHERIPKIVWGRMRGPAGLFFAFWLVYL